VAKGTAIHLYFPKAEPRPSVSEQGPIAKAAPRNGELILIVEDNDNVREATVRRLQLPNYTVLGAHMGPEAQIARNWQTRCPRLRGYHHPRWHDGMQCGGVPNLKVLLTSGCTNLQTAVKDVDREAKVLAKPYTRVQLAQALREALERC
jgi:DNA-binding NtrC family response regulator